MSTSNREVSDLHSLTDTHTGLREIADDLAGSPYSPLREVAALMRTILAEMDGIRGTKTDDEFSDALAIDDVTRARYRGLVNELSRLADGLSRIARGERDSLPE
jgi:hypothetical protein